MYSWSRSRVRVSRMYEYSEECVWLRCVRWCRVVRLQEVVGRSSGDVRLSSSRSRIELQEGVLQVLVDLHDRSLIATAIALRSTTHTKTTATATQQDSHINIHLNERVEAQASSHGGLTAVIVLVLGVLC